MKTSKAPLVMMEQMIMVLVFALAAALCLQAFVLSEKISKKTEAANYAAIETQNAAEQIKADGFSAWKAAYDALQREAMAVVFFDEEWNRVSEQEAEYVLEAAYTEGTYLWQAELCMSDAAGEPLVILSVAGQVEVVQNEET